MGLIDMHGPTMSQDLDTGPSYLMLCPSSGKFTQDGYDQCQEGGTFAPTAVCTVEVETVLTF